MWLVQTYVRVGGNMVLLGTDWFRLSHSSMAYSKDAPGLPVTAGGYFRTP